MKAVALRELFAVFGIDFETQALNAGSAAVDNAWGEVQKFGQLVASAWITKGVYDLTTSVADMADELTDAGTAVGLSAKEMLTWRTVAQSVGVGAEQLRGVFGAFSRNVGGARDGNRDLVKTFEDLGVALEVGSVARDTNAVLSDTLTQLGQMEDPTSRAALAMRLLGEQGARLLPAFENGSAGLEEISTAVDQLFGSSLEEAAAQADELERQTAILDLSLMSLKTSIGLELLPGLVDLITYGRQAAEWFSGMAKNTNLVQAAFAVLGPIAVALGIKMLIPFLPALATILLVAVAVGALILIVDDLIALFSGGDSVIGEFVDSVWGVGTSKQAVTDLKLAWEGLNLALSDAWTWIKDVSAEANAAIAPFIEWADKVDLLTHTFEALGEMIEGVGDVLSVFESPFAKEVRRQEAARDRRRAQNADGLLGGEATRVRGLGTARVEPGTRAERTAQMSLPPAARANQNVQQVNNTTYQITSTSPEEVAAEVEMREQQRREGELRDVRESLTNYSGG